MAGAKPARRAVLLFPEHYDLCPGLAHSLAPLPLPLAAGSTTTGSGGGGTRCRAATLAATVEGPGFPFSMASERMKKKQEEIDDRRMRDAIPPSPSL